MTSSTLIDQPRQAGRPREFDMNAALDRAVEVFSLQGYHATSIGDLQAAMGVAAGSLYKAFKDKKAIFLATFDRYKVVRNAMADAAIAKGVTGREKLFEVLRFYAEASAGEQGRRGCLVVGTAAELAVCDPDAAERVTRSNAYLEARFGALVAEGREDGSIAPHIDAAVMARLMLCVVQGMRVVGKTDHSDRPPMDVVAATMKLFD